MRKIILLGIATYLIAAGSAAAQDVRPEGAWCGREDIGGGVVAERCHFDSYDECRKYSGGITTFCTRNPRYVAPRPPAVADPRNQQPRRP